MSTTTTYRGHERRLARTWDALPVWVSARCPGDGHESAPWSDGHYVVCTVCGRRMPEHGRAYVRDDGTRRAPTS